MTQHPSSALSIPSLQPDTRVLKPRCKVSVVGRVLLTEPIEQPGGCNSRFFITQLLTQLPFPVPFCMPGIMGLEKQRMWETGMQAFALSTARFRWSGLGLGVVVR